MKKFESKGFKKVEDFLLFQTVKDIDETCLCFVTKHFEVILADNDYHDKEVGTLIGIARGLEICGRLTSEESRTAINEIIFCGDSDAWEEYQEHIQELKGVC